MSAFCIAIIFGTFKGVAPYPSDRVLPMPKVILFLGVIAPWCAGIYFAYRAARTANKGLGAIGSAEVLLVLLLGALPILSG